MHIRMYATLLVPIDDIKFGCFSLFFYNITLISDAMARAPVMWE